MLTKKDLEEIKAIIDESLDIKLDEKLDVKLDEKLKFLPSKAEFFNKMDKLIKEIRDLREEVTIVTGYKDQIEDHETRIEKVENILQPQSA